MYQDRKRLKRQTAHDRDHQGADELRIFRAFVKAAGLAVPSESIQKRQPPEPDIQCELGELGSTYFELVEVLDSKLARAVGNQLALPQRMSEVAENLGLSGFWDALISVRFVDTAGSEKRIKAIPLVIAWLQQLRPGFRGKVTIKNDSKLNTTVH